MRESSRCALAQLGLEGQAVRGAGAPGRRRPGAAAAALRRRGALAEGPGHREGRRHAGRAQAGDAADRPDLRGRLRPARCSRTKRRSASSPRSTSKIAGKQIVAHGARVESPASGQVIDLMEALRASLGKRGAKAKAAKAPAKAAARAGGRRRGSARARTARPPKRRAGTRRARAKKSPSRARRARAQEVTAPTPSASRLHAAPASRRCWACRAASSFAAGRRRLRHAEPRPAQRVPLHASRTWCCCAPRTSCRRRRIPPRKILRSLQPAARRRCPSELPLTGLRISAVGNDVAVREGGAQWHADSGQLLMDFEVAPAHGQRHVPAAHRRRGAARRRRAPAAAVDAGLSASARRSRRATARPPSPPTAR